MTTNESISDELLCAYMDNELELPARQQLEQQLAESEALQDRLQALVEADTLVRQAFTQRAPLHSGSTGIPAPVTPLPHRNFFKQAGGLLAASVVGIAIGINVPFNNAIEGEMATQWSAQQTLSRSLESQPQFQSTMESNISGVAVQWSNPDQSPSRLLPVRTYKTGSGTYCREFLLEDSHEQVNGVVCRTPEGSWQIVNMQYNQLEGIPNIKI
ncbi:hypothetical protein [Aestuariirhabdus sp. LZHN29]|uniref:hypothetical protein n=1 Tax=Aestuariirhabdus sp. LZHN29 TaxID=3417462 RepID=UPI003CE99A3C